MAETNAEAAQIQWCPSGNPLDGKPGEVLGLLATNGTHHGYGYGPGLSVAFGTARGDVLVMPGQWITRHPDGRVEVTDEPVCSPASTDQEAGR